ncbi:MAG: DUF5009 domain-containing protein [Alistipes sp.]|jgi:hypothetical protein|nr:DUF5009 domain-containing protein [Alistipes sp.]
MGTTSSLDFGRRNTGIDLFRALTMFVMIFVNDFWKIHDVPHWLEHAAGREDFMGLADVVYPCFLFVVGMSIPFAIERRYGKGLSGESTIGHILSRTLALLVMGAFISNSEARLSPDSPYPIGVYWILMVAGFILVWNQYPKREDHLFTVMKAIGVLILGYLAITFRNPDGGVFAARWGILGSIGWSYLICAMVYVFTRDRLKYLIPVLVSFVLVCILGARMNELHGGESLLNLPRPNFYNDFMNGVLHLGGGSAAALTMGGVVFSLLVTKYADMSASRKLLWSAGAVAVFCVLGVVARQFWILSKIGATPTWIFFIFAIAVGLYTLLDLLVRRGWTGWMRIIAPAGTATLTCYLMPYLAYAFSSISGATLPDVLTYGVVGILNCLCFALFIIGVTWAVGRMGIKLKI